METATVASPATIGSTSGSGTPGSASGSSKTSARSPEEGAAAPSEAEGVSGTGIVSSGVSSLMAFLCSELSGGSYTGTDGAREGCVSASAEGLVVSCPTTAEETTVSFDSAGTDTGPGPDGDSGTGNIGSVSFSDEPPCKSGFCVTTWEGPPLWLPPELSEGETAPSPFDSWSVPLFPGWLGVGSDNSGGGAVSGFDDSGGVVSGSGSGSGGSGGLTMSVPPPRLPPGSSFASKLSAAKRSTLE